MTTYLESLQKGLHAAMKEDPVVYILGEDILDPYGGAFKVTRGLSTSFPERVITTPISEAGFVGVANGMALRGLKPVVEIMFGDFITLAADQIINYAAKFSSMYQNENPSALVLRAPMGAGRGYGPTHSQSLEKIFLGIPGLKIIAPSHFHNPGSILKSAILLEKEPVIFIEHKLLYLKQLIRPENQPNLHITYTDDPYPTAIINNSTQKPDVTLITYGGAGIWLEPLLQKLKEEEIYIQICLPSCLQPIDIDSLVNACQRSDHVIIVEESSEGFNWSSEITAQLQMRLWGKLKSPIHRITSKNTVIPAAKSLEEIYLPSSEVIEKAIVEVLL